MESRTLTIEGEDLVLGPLPDDLYEHLQKYVPAWVAMKKRLGVTKGLVEMAEVIVTKRATLYGTAEYEAWLARDCAGLRKWLPFERQAARARAAAAAPPDPDYF